MPITKISVNLAGIDGNAFSIMGAVSSALKKSGHKGLAKQFMDEATSGDYNHLLQVVMTYVEVVWGENIDQEEEDADSQ